MRKTILLFLISVSFLNLLTSQTNPLWTEKKVKNYLPHMSVLEVEDFLTRSDMVLIPVGALEQHAGHLPIGTDFLNGVERAKLIAQERDILIAPILMAGQSPYHMGFAGTISLSAETILAVHLEAVKSLIHHGFKRFIIMNAHGGNRAISTLLVDQINQTTGGIAVSYGDAVSPFYSRSTTPNTNRTPATLFDRHGGTPETSTSMYLIPSLVQMDKAVTPVLTLPEHMQAILPQVIAGDPTALMVFLAEGLKAESTGKKTSTAEMSSTGVWGERNPNESTLERGRNGTLRSVEAATKFIDKWNELRPYKGGN